VLKNRGYILPDIHSNKFLFYTKCLYDSCLTLTFSYYICPIYSGRLCVNTGKEFIVVDISYRDQVIWGTSLDMAEENEIEKSYDYIRRHIEENNGIYYTCEHSKGTKNFIDMRWLCGEAAHSSDLCNKNHSIKKEDLIREIEEMVSNEIDVSGEKIIKSFKKRGYIDIYKCNRVFFIKKISNYTYT